MLKIGLPAGVEFGLMGVYMVVVYAISRRFGAAAQAGFGVGFRIVQSAFLPIVALGFAVAPVAGQNFGAGKGDRVRAVFKTAASIAAGLHAPCSASAIYLAAPQLIRLFSADPEVIHVGVDYLHIVTLNFVTSGITFVSASMFQGMGNTLPSLATSFLRMCRRHRPGHRPVAAAGVRADLDLVVHRAVDHAADGAEPDPAAAGVPAEAGVARSRDNRR